MAWTAPKTWTVEPLTVADMNTHIRDNLLALRNPPSYSYGSGINYTTSSASPVDIDSTNMNETITLESDGDVLVGFNGTTTSTDGAYVIFAIFQDGVEIHRSLMSHHTSGRYRHSSLSILIEGLAAGDYTFTMKWMRQSGTITLHSGTNQFYIRGQ